MLRRTSWLGFCAVVSAMVPIATGGPFPVVLRAQPADAGPRVSIELASQQEHYRPRVTMAVQESLANYREWLGPYPAERISIHTKASADSARTDLPTVTVDLAWRPAPRSMDVESQVAYGVARLWWPRLLETPDTRPIVDGLAWYLQSRVVERLFDATFFVPAHSTDAVSYFGGALPWALRSLTLGRWTAGLGRNEFLRATNTVRWPRIARRLPPGADVMTPQGALAFGALERLVGWPALEGALRALATRASAGPMTRAETEQTISAAVGQSLSWFFANAFDAGTRFDYALAAASTEPGPTPCSNGPCYRTRATVVRRGDALFTGTDRAPNGPYAAGDALELRVTFADGQKNSVRWDGRQDSKTFEFDSPAPAVAVQLDPERVLLLDHNYLDDDWRAEATTNVPVEKWVAWWLIWVQDATLSYGALF